MAWFLRLSLHAMSLSKAFKGNPSHLGKKTAKQRHLEFKGQTYVDDGMLFCKVCSLSRDHRRRSTIVEHFSSKRHKCNEEKARSHPSCSRQPTVVSAFFKNTAKEHKGTLIHDLVLAFASADIAFEMLNNPALREFLRKHVQDGGCIPTADRLRRGYLEPVYIERIETIRKMLEQSDSVTVIADETTDDQNRAILNIILIPCVEFLKNEEKMQPWLVETVERTATSGNVVGGAVLRTLVENRVAYDKVVAFMSDNVSYMAVAYRIVQCL